MQSIHQLHVRDSLRQRDVLKWQTVDINAIEYNLQQNRLSIEKIALLQPYVRFIINENLTTNISELMIAQPEKAEMAGKADGPSVGPAYWRHQR